MVKFFIIFILQRFYFNAQNIKVSEKFNFRNILACLFCTTLMSPYLLCQLKNSIIYIYIHIIIDRRDLNETSFNSYIEHVQGLRPHTFFDNVHSKWGMVYLSCFKSADALSICADVVSSADKSMEFGWGPIVHFSNGATVRW